MTKLTSASSSLLNAEVNDNGVGAVVAADAVVVDEGFEEEVMWLMGAEIFSVGRPCLSKKSSACFATCSAVNPSTSFPMISLMRGGMVFSQKAIVFISPVV